MEHVISQVNKRSKSILTINYKNMYFWNIKKLNKDLSKGLEQKEDFKYLLVYLVVSLSLLFSSTE